MTTDSFSLAYEQREVMRYKIKYAIEYGRRYSRLLTRCQWAIRIFTLLGATAAMAAIGGSVEPLFITFAGIAVAGLTILEAVVDPGRLAEKCRVAVEEVRALDAEAELLTDEQLRAKWAKLPASDLPQLELLRVPVANEIVRRLNLSSQVRPTNFAQSIVYWIT